VLRSQQKLWSEIEQALPYLLSHRDTCPRIKLRNKEARMSPKTPTQEADPQRNRT